MNKLFITDLAPKAGLTLKEIFKSAVCVDKCPKATGVGAGEWKCRPTKTVPDCKAIKSYTTTEVVTYCFP
jgi:hypothetical protein